MASPFRVITRAVAGNKITCVFLSHLDSFFADPTTILPPQKKKKKVTRAARRRLLGTRLTATFCQIARPSLHEMKGKDDLWTRLLPCHLRSTRQIEGA